MRHDTIRKVMGLQAKARDPSASPSEQDGAARMADRLMRKHNLDQSDLVDNTTPDRDNPDPQKGDFSETADIFDNLWT